MRQDLADRFCSLFQVPSFFRPYLHFFFAPGDLDLVLAAGEKGLSPAEMAGISSISMAEAGDRLESGYRRFILEREEKDGERLYRAGHFYDKLDYECKFGPRYGEMPRALRRRLDRWCFEQYKKQLEEDVGKAMAGNPAAAPSETYILLPEAEEFIDAARRIRLIPCNCRRLAESCRRPVEVCLCFDDAIGERTFGESISREDTQRLVREADRQGLMHTVNSDWRENGPRFMCNCCACCCYPSRLAAEMGSTGVWPLSRYRASLDAEKCTVCSRCVRRCLYQAFSAGEPGEAAGSSILFDPSKCVGCGLCRTACPAGAITMIPVIKPGSIDRAGNVD